DLHERRPRRGSDRNRRLARHGDGRGRPVTTFYDEVQELKGSYEDWRSATMPALRLAQEKHGYLSPDALRETAEALGTTPAFCESVATFYDMLHLQPVGRHMVEVCTNLPCALAGAQPVVEAFEEQLGLRAGE